jgi:hypothetical protein
MNMYEHLETDACEDGIDIIHYDFKRENIKGLYCDGTIGINKSIDTSTEKACVLAEELGHHYTSFGNILDQSITENRKQENRARMWAYNKCIGLLGIIESFRRGCCNLYDMAEYLDVTESFLSDALDAYRLKYGRYVIVDNYTIYFEPNLYVAEMNFQ